VPPVAASALQCSEPSCLSGTRPAAHGGPLARAARRAPTAAAAMRAARDCKPTECGANHNQVLA
jgi:hypothetical protein